MSDSLEDDLAAWLADGATLALGEDLFVSTLPESPVLATAVRSTGGPDRAFSPLQPATFQVLSRAAGYAAARARAIALYDVVYPPPERVPARNVDLSDDWLVTAIDAVQPPYDLGPSEGGGHLVVFNLVVRAGRRAGA